MAMTFQSASFASVLAHLAAPNQRVKNASILKRNVFVKIDEPVRQRVEPLYTGLFHDLKATRRGLRVGKGQDRAFIAWCDVTHIPSPVGRVLDAGGSIKASTLTVKARVASSLGLV